MGPAPFKIAVFAFLLLFSELSLAEYRVFLLKVTAADGTPVRELASTLDPDQYRGYYHLPAGQKLSYQQTWRCKGQTGGFTPLCPNPKADPPP